MVSGLASFEPSGSCSEVRMLRAQATASFSRTLWRIRSVTSHRWLSSKMSLLIRSKPILMASATASSSYGFTTRASNSSCAAPASSESTIVPGMAPNFFALGSLATRYSFATRFMPSINGVTRQMSARAYKAASSSIEMERWMYTIGWCVGVENWPLMVLMVRCTSSSMLLYSWTSWREGTAMKRKTVCEWSTGSFSSASLPSALPSRYVNEEPIRRREPLATAVLCRRASKRFWRASKRSARPLNAAFSGDGSPSKLSDGGFLFFLAAFFSAHTSSR
mmetsp:Transcript_84407/g.217381  ORF Transcript_84407/g.217381 Transcript_84407/m.217381 type:complete len:278 (-) Transcript_84407:567-1400(-)